jgi:alpha-ribazole phosphatase
MSLTLMRHPAIDFATQRCIGQTDVGLSPAGNLSLESLAAEACRLLPDRIISSDLKRCRVLAEAIANRLGIEPVFDPVWREVDFGLWENRTWEAIRSEEIGAYTTWVADFVNTVPPGGESFSQVQKRVMKAISSIFADAEKLAPSVLVVTHGGVIRATYAAWVNLPLSQAFDYSVPFGGMLHLNRNSLEIGRRWSNQRENPV